MRRGAVALELSNQPLEFLDHFGQVVGGGPRIRCALGCALCRGRDRRDFRGYLLPASRCFRHAARDLIGGGRLPFQPHWREA